MPPLLWDANKTVQYTCTGKAALAAMCCCWCGSCCWELMAAAGLWQLCPAAGRQAPCVRCLLLATELIRSLAAEGAGSLPGRNMTRLWTSQPGARSEYDVADHYENHPCISCLEFVNTPNSQLRAVSWRFAILSKNVTTFSAETNKLVTNDLPTDFSSNSKPIRHVTKFPVRMPIITMDHLR